MGRHSHGGATPAPAPAAGPGPAGPPRRVRAWRRALLVALALAAAATVAGLVLLWPRGAAPAAEPGFTGSQNISAEAVAGRVLRVDRGPCGSPDSGAVFDGDPAPAAAPGFRADPRPMAPPPGATPAPGVDPVPAPPAPGQGLAPPECDAAVVALTGGPDAGRRTLLETSGRAGDPDLAAGDEIVLAIQPGPGGNRYGFLDIARGPAMWAWLAATAAGIVLIGAWRGVRAVLGLGLTLAVVGLFLVPALLRGGPPVALATVTGAAAMIPVMLLVHGVNWKTGAALGGTLCSLSAAAGLAHAAIATADVRGLADDSNLLIQLYLPTVSVTGLLLAGFIVGALGALNDATIAQASTVTELAEADPAAGPWRLFAAAMRVGRDHIASMVYTLLLAYVGASLPMTLLLSVADRPLTQVLTSDLVATELLRSVVGALALTLAVPVTTAIAALTAHGRPGASAPAR